MEYLRYLAAVEKFFENADLSLKKRGADYPDSELAPSFLLIDEARKNYYLMEIFFPPTEPPLEERLCITINEYIKENQGDENALKAMVVMGKVLLSAQEDIQQLPLVSGYAMKLAVVATDEFSTALAEQLKSAEIKYESVPVKGKFVIYFISNSSFAALEKFYRALSEPPKSEPDIHDPSEDDADEAFEESFKSEAVQETPPPRQIRDETPETAAEIDLQTVEAAETPIETAPETPIETAETPLVSESGVSESGADVETEPSIETETALTEAAAETPAQAPAELEPDTAIDAASAADTAINAADAAETNPYAVQADISDENIPAFINDLEKFHKRINRNFGFEDAMRHLWSFFVFAPAYLISRLTRKRLPMFISYWLGGMCVMLGAYYPLAYLFKPLENLATTDIYTATASLNELLRLTGGLVQQIDVWVSNLFGMAFAVNMVLVELVKFINSVFYMQIFLSVGYFIAIIPAWRGFGKKMISFLIVFYITFIPFTELAALAGNRLALYYIVSTAPIMGGLNLMGSIGCYILTMFSAPLVAALLSYCAAKSKADVL
ncbi:MAG: hypothetical protein LBP51_07395 [Deferribacteraceae bacterium]|jgi:hypothetical protein|nr:hypothetical protein [Deferribacteraceae bacterium]